VRPPSWLSRRGGPGDLHHSGGCQPLVPAYAYFRAADYRLLMQCGHVKPECQHGPSCSTIRSRNASRLSVASSSREELLRSKRGCRIVSAVTSEKSSSSSQLPVNCQDRSLGNLDSKLILLCLFVFRVQVILIISRRDCSTTTQGELLDDKAATRISTDTRLECRGEAIYRSREGISAIS
jgi:hypothetical protein